MTGILVFIAVLVFIAHACKGAADSLQFHFNRSFARDWGAQFWNPAESWRNKYQDGDKTKGEKFPGSSTIFVAFTDGWHLLQTAQYLALRLALTLAVTPVRVEAPGLADYALTFAALWIVGAAGFTLTYKILKVK